MLIVLGYKHVRSFCSVSNSLYVFLKGYKGPKGEKGERGDRGLRGDPVNTV